MVVGAYKLVKAKDPQEAINNSPFFIGQKAEVIEIKVTGNSDGTWTVIPEFKLIETKKSS